MECGTLFEAEILDLAEQRCPVCGNPPTGKILAGTAADKEGAKIPAVGSDSSKSLHKHSGVTQDTREIYEATLEAQSKKSRGRVKRTKRKEKRGKKILTMLLVWVVLMALIIGLMKYFNPEEEGAGNDLEALAAREQRQEQADRKMAQSVIQKAAPRCRKVITQFLNAPSAAGKAQFVYQGRKLTSEMSRYYQRNPSFSSTRSQVKIAHAELLKGTEKQTIGTVCVNQQEEKFEAVFVRDGGEWKLDWQAAVRYSTRSWSVFPSGGDGDEGEFRLYMRVRDSNKKFNSEEINLVFYNPEIYTKSEFRGIPSPSVSVKIDSDLGAEILKMVEREEDMKQDNYGFSVGIFDPPGYHRVRVKMRLKKDGHEHSFELLEILANHWYGAGVVDAESEDAAED